MSSSSSAASPLLRGFCLFNCLWNPIPLESISLFPSLPGHPQLSQVKCYIPCRPASPSSPFPTLQPADLSSTSTGHDHVTSCSKLSRTCPWPTPQGPSQVLSPPARNRPPLPQSGLISLLWLNLTHPLTQSSLSFCSTYAEHGAP